MWLFTTFGFFSIVQKKEGGDILTVRARVRADLDRLRKCLPSLSDTIAGGGTDYPYRATVDRDELGEALREMCAGIAYPNFKNKVRETLGSSRESLYHNVWEAMLDAEQMEQQPARRAGAPRTTRPIRYGGVVLNDLGEVLLVEPKNHFGGVIWSFPKGTPEEGETPEQTALREVNEETNVSAEIVGKIPGTYTGSESENVHFLMKVKGRPGSEGGEAQAIRWVRLDLAPDFLRQTRTVVSRERDLRVLEVAREFIAVLPKKG